MKNIWKQQKIEKAEYLSINKIINFANIKKICYKMSENNITNNLSNIGINGNKG